MIRAKDTDITTFALAVARNAHEWLAPPPVCKGCKRPIRGVSCACFKEVHS